ncbi:YaeQ family protein [Flocculibacter collagenilyticus]|uniref:YaeQ family protein n=1 Tax=Flocculibacter collagenilyticus TaxID=2744479 RepID=UPI0018F77757|nr:YaeQ family protein [Flocculibacter collagenilyticus]
MGDKAILFNTHIDVANLDKHRYDSLHFTVALNHAETLEHLVMRVLAFSLVPDGIPHFTKHPNSTDTPDIYTESYEANYGFWINIGMPEIKQLKRASKSAEHVIIFMLKDRKWLEDNQLQLIGLSNLTIISLSREFISELSYSLDRSIHWSVVLDGKKLSVSDQHQFYSTEIDDFHSVEEEELLH